MSNREQVVLNDRYELQRRVGRRAENVAPPCQRIGKRHHRFERDASRQRIAPVHRLDLDQEIGDQDRHHEPGEDRDFHRVGHTAHKEIGGEGGERDQTAKQPRRDERAMAGRH